MTAPIGAHASALMALRAKSLQAYGVDQKMLTNIENHTLLPLVENQTRALALSKREERAIAVQHEHSLLLI
ncbi:MAG: hypothetical protein HHAS10_06570 [Candidatus Altimarinota bacterium]